MDRMQMPRGLIRYSTENVISGKHPAAAWHSHILRPRVIGYGLVLASVVGIMLFALADRDPFRVNVIREGAVLSRPTADGRIENLYRVKVFNMDEHPRRYRISAEGLPSLSLAALGGAEFEVPAVGYRTLEVYLRVDPDQVAKGAHDVRFTVVSSDDGEPLSVVERSTFLVR
jgi:polyferredoxin